MAFRPKEVLRQAREAEAQSQVKEAATYYAQVGSFLLRRGEIEKAATLFQKSVSLFPKGSRPYVYLAICDMELNRPEAAEESMRTLARLSLEKRSTGRYAELVTERLQKYPRLPECFFETILSLDRTVANHFHLFGRFLLRCQKFTRARRVLIEAFQSKLDDEGTLKLLREVLAAQGDDSAQTYLDRYKADKLPRAEFITLLSESEGSQSGISIHAVVAGGGKFKGLTEQERTLGDLIRELEREVGGDTSTHGDGTGPLVQEFRRRAEPILARSGKARTDIAMAFFEMGLVEEACEELGKVTEGSLEFCEAQCLLGTIYQSEGSYLAALEALQNCLRHEPRTADVRFEALYRMAQVQLRLEDVAGARAAIQRLEKENPVYRDCQHLRREIEEKLNSK